MHSAPISISPTHSLFGDFSGRLRYSLDIHAADGVRQAAVENIQQPFRPGANRKRELRHFWLIRHRVAVTARIGAGDAIPACRIDEHGGRAAGYTLRAYSAGVVAAGLQFLEDLIGDGSFDVQAIESRVVRPEGTKEVERLHPGPLESFVQVG